MISLRSAIVAFMSGLLLALGWVIYLDGELQSHDAFNGWYFLPCLFSTVAAVMLNLVSIKYISSNNAVKAWVFVWLVVHFLCIGCAIYILSTGFAPEDNYAGITILLQTVIVMMSAILYFMGRKPITSSGNFLE